jgi:hypothetical protein
MLERAMSPVLVQACRVCFSKNNYFFGTMHLSS